MRVPDLVHRTGVRLASALTRRWPPRSRLFLVGEGVEWSIDHDLRELDAVARRAGIVVAPRRLLSASRDQVAFYGSQFTLLRDAWGPPRHNLATAYLHGRPGTPGYPEFDECFRVLKAHHGELAGVQVSHSEVEALVLESGIAPEKVVRIPIGVDTALFSPQKPPQREAARGRLGIPLGAFVVGSFQKDGVGFAEGMEPKLIKGPDVLLAALERLVHGVPELHVLLTGPARGFVRAGLERLGITYTHRLLRRYEEVATIYPALDAYVVASRQEGGPKGVFEAMASGVPVVTTRVGQAMDLVRHGENGWVVDVEDGDGLAHWLEHVAGAPADLPTIVASGLDTAQANSYESLFPRWFQFLSGLVDIS